MSKVFSANRLDIKAFAQEGATLRGEAPLRTYSRLFEETGGRGAEVPVSWRARGEIRNPDHVVPEIWLELRADATLALTCQRCLGQVEVPVSVNRLFRFVSDEEMAAAQDEESEEDVLALSRSFDLAALIEDELLMELPLAPRHASCPQPLRQSAVDPDFDSIDVERENPFAVLGRLKNGKS